MPILAVDNIVPGISFKTLKPRWRERRKTAGERAMCSMAKCACGDASFVKNGRKLILNSFGVAFNPQWCIGIVRVCMLCEI
jgi:hypothetical protein